MIYYLVILVIFILFKVLFNLYNNYNFANKIIHNLWVGNKKAAFDRSFLKKNNIKLIINCTKTIPFIDNNNIKKYRLSVHDNGSKETKNGILSNIDEIIELIDNSINKKEGILIHCYAGMQRAPTIACCYLIHKLNINNKKAIQYIKNQRKVAFRPIINYKNVIYKFYIKKLK